MVSGPIDRGSCHRCLQSMYCVESTEMIPLWPQAHCIPRAHMTGALPLQVQRWSKPSRFHKRDG